MSVKPHRAGFLDIGTNTVLLLVVDIKADASYQVLEDHCEIARLGEGLHRSSRFSPQATERTLSAIQKFVSICRSQQCDFIRAVGTAAFRKAANAHDFVAQVASQTGLTIEVISGEDEARAISEATRLDFLDFPLPQLTLDIGGGSTEFILRTEDSGSDRFVSLPFGVVRLTEKFLHNDPPLSEQIESLRAFVRSEIASVVATFLPAPKMLIATAGTPTTLSALWQELPRYDSAKVHRSVLKIDDLAQLVGRLSGEPLAQRQTWPCLPPKRADVIVAGGLILLEVLAGFGFSQLHVSDRGLRFGLLNAYLKSQNF